MNRLSEKESALKLLTFAHNPRMEKGVTPEMARSFDFLIRTEIPLDETAEARLMAPYIRREWGRFLFKYRRSSSFLRDYLAYGPEQFENFNQAYLQKKILRISSWIHQAREEFLAGKISFLWNCRVLDHRDRPKHWRPHGFSDSKIQKQSSKNEEGIFVPGMVPKFLLQGLRCIFAVNYEQVRSRKLRFASFNYGMVIGYAAGNPTSIVRYDIDYTAVHAHAYPITPEEARKHPLTTLDDLDLELGVLVPANSTVSKSVSKK